MRIKMWGTNLKGAPKPKLINQKKKLNKKLLFMG